MTKRAKKRIISLSAIIAVVLILMTVITNVMYYYKEYMDQFLGAGTIKTETSSDGLSGDYIEYTATSDTESRDNAAAITQETAEEGIVLLRNDEKADGVNGKALPLVSSSDEAASNTFC